MEAAAPRGAANVADRRLRRRAGRSVGVLPPLVAAIALAFFNRLQRLPPSFAVVGDMMPWAAPRQVDEIDEIDTDEVSSRFGLSPLEILGYVAFAISFQVIRVRGKRFENQQMVGERLLSMSKLNDAMMFKEVFMAYLNAAILEPVLTIAGEEPELTPAGLAVNLAMMFSIGWWIFILTDAFDTSDVQLTFLYQVLETESEQAPAWFRPSDKTAKKERKKLVGSIYYDLGLWFVLGAIMAALVGTVTHRNVFHAWMLLLLWAVMHHRCISITNWGTSYWVSFFLPSSALMPMELVLPLADDSNMASMEALGKWRKFIEDETQVKLTIEH